MAVPQRIREHIETELRRVGDQLRGMGSKPICPDSAALSGGIAGIGDFYDLALASEAKRRWPTTPEAGS